MKIVNDKRPWGGFEQFTLNKISTVKILTVKSGKRTSMQKHSKREEFWKVIEGECRVWIGDKKLKARKGDEFFIRKGKLHRLEGLKKEAKVLEISFGRFDERDIERVEDDFGRIQLKKSGQ